MQRNTTSPTPVSEAQIFETSRRHLMSLVIALVAVLAFPLTARAQQGADGDDATIEAPAEAPDGPDQSTEPGAEPDATADPADDVGAEPDADADATGADADAGEASGERLRTGQRLREIGNQVDALKEDTFATKSRLLLLRESVLRRSLAGSKIVVVHQDDMGSEYDLVQVLYSLDGEAQLVRREGQGIDELDNTVVFDKKVVPGSHLLSVAFVYKGNAWGIFSYNEGYTYKLKASETFTVEEGIAYEITVRAFEDGGFFTPIEKRPNIEFTPAKHPLENEFAPADNER